jgi:maltooligosyltrehalose trehalohydrolase
VAELAAIFRQGWLFTGQHSKHWGRPRGTDPSRVPLRQSVVCIQNHDQVGNRALGDRLNHKVDAASFRAATALLLTAPMTPLLFMGQEWAAGTPFAFFTDFGPDLAASVVEGRRREFAAFPEFSTAAAAARIPNPQAAQTFEASKLRWDEASRDPFARALALNRRLLALRAAEPAFRAADAASCDAEAVGDDAIAYRRDADGSPPCLVVVRLRGAGRVSPRALSGGRWSPVLDTEDAAFAVEPRPPRIDAGAGTIDFARPGAVIFRQAE